MSQNGNFCLHFENNRKGPFLRLQMRAKEMFNRHQYFFPQIKRYSLFKFTTCSLDFAELEIFLNRT